MWGIALILPNTLGLFLFFGLPVLIAFVTSLLEWNGIRAPEFIAIDNFIRLSEDDRFWQALRNTLTLLVMIVPLEIFLALSVAMMLNQRVYGRNLLRVIYFLPVVTSTVAASVVWAWIFQPTYGLLEAFIGPFGFTDVRWLTRPDLVLIPIAAVAIWQRLGFDMVLFLAGLQTIPRVLYEAAIIDGASRWHQLRYVTLPMLSPTTFLVLVLAIIQGFQIFDQVFIMTARTVPGGVGGSATTLTYLMYRSGFVRSEFGYASAVAVVLFLIIMMVTMFQLRFQRNWVYYESGEAR